MKLPAPKLPDYDVARWSMLPFPERLKLACQAWAIDGYGAPGLIYVVYLLKVGLYVGGWAAFCARSTTLGGLTTLSTWWFQPEALQKAVLWSMLFEVLGL